MPTLRISRRTLISPPISNTLENEMYGGRTAGMFGYSHFTGGFAGGQAEYTRVPFGDVNLLKLPDDVPDEKGLFLSDVIPTSWNWFVTSSQYLREALTILLTIFSVVDTGVKEGCVRFPTAVFYPFKLSNAS